MTLLSIEDITRLYRLAFRKEMNHYGWFIVEHFFLAAVILASGWVDDDGQTALSLSFTPEAGNHT